MNADTYVLGRFLVDLTERAYRGRVVIRRRYSRALGVCDGWSVTVKHGGRQHRTSGSTLLVALEHAVKKLVALETEGTIWAG